MKMLISMAVASALVGCGNKDSTPAATTDTGTTVADTTPAVDTTEPAKDNGVTPDPGEMSDIVIKPKADTATAEDTGPVIDVKGPPATCLQAYVCAGECQKKGDATCIDKCEEGGAGDIKTKLDAVLACQKDKCATGTLDTCATDKTQCWESLKPCAYESTPGTDKCKVAFACLKACAGDGLWTCTADCLGKVNAEQQHDLITYALCIKNHCGLSPDDQCIHEADNLECGPAAGFCSG